MTTIPTIETLEVRVADLLAAALNIEGQLGDPDRRGPDGERMDYRAWGGWRRRAIVALNNYRREYREAKAALQDAEWEDENEPTD